MSLFRRFHHLFKSARSNVWKCPSSYIVSMREHLAKPGIHVVLVERHEQRVDHDAEGDEEVGKWVKDQHGKVLKNSMKRQRGFVRCSGRLKALGDRGPRSIPCLVKFLLREGIHLWRYLVCLPAHSAMCNKVLLSGQTSS
jgi:hypothetical protein